MIKLYPPGPFPPNGKMIIIEQENSIQIPVRSFDTHGLSNVSPHLMSILHSIAIYLFELWFIQPARFGAGCYIEMATSYH